MTKILDNPQKITFTAIGLGLLLSVVMGAANVYLGLKAGMTVSASIPAAVIAMGVLMMIPMRRVFVVENTDLKYPEAVACAEVLRAGCGEAADGASTGIALVMGGVGLAAVFKFAASFLGLLQSGVEGAVQWGQRVFYFGADVSPALLAVGYIVGLSIAVQVFLGGAIGWLITIPILGAETGGSETAVDAAWTLCTSCWATPSA